MILWSVFAIIGRSWQTGSRSKRWKTHCCGEWIYWTEGWFLLCVFMLRLFILLDFLYCMCLTCDFSVFCLHCCNYRISVFVSICLWCIYCASLVVLKLNNCICSRFLFFVAVGTTQAANGNVQQFGTRCSCWWYGEF